MQCPCPLTLPDEPGQWLNAHIPPLPWSQSYRSIGGQDTGISEKFLFPLSLHSTNRTCCPAPPRVIPRPPGRTSQANTVTHPLTARGAHSSKFQHHLHALTHLSHLLLAHMLTSSTQDGTAHGGEFLPSQCLCVIFHSQDLSLIQDQPKVNSPF